MAIGVTIEKKTVPGAAYSIDALVVLDNSYPNPAGYVLTPATFGLGIMRSIIYAGAATVAAGANEPVLVPTYNTDGSGHIASVALHLVVGSTGAEVANGVNLSTSSLLFKVEGV